MQDVENTFVPNRQIDNTVAGEYIVVVMGNPTLPGKRTTTLNLVEADLEVARDIAAARGVATSAVLREAIRVGLPLLLKRDAELFKGLPKLKAVTKSPAPLMRRKSTKQR